VDDLHDGEGLSVAAPAANGARVAHTMQQRVRSASSTPALFRDASSVMVRAQLTPLSQFDVSSSQEKPSGVMPSDQITGKHHA